jgi:hypothetical protein
MPRGTPGRNLRTKRRFQYRGEYRGPWTANRSNRAHSDGEWKPYVDVSRIASLRSQGRSWAQITDEIGVSKGTAQRAVVGLPKIAE